jgi:hypothetical protein
VRRRVSLALAAPALAAMGCTSPFTTPTPPMQAETAALVAEYETPTGSIDITLIQAVLGAINAKLPDLQIDWFPQVAENLLANVGERIDKSGLPDDPDASVETHHFVLSAVVDVQEICPGFGNPPGPVSVANGVMNATAVIQSGRLEPEVWANVNACQQNLALLDNRLSGEATFGGTVIIYLLGPLPTSIDNARFVFSFTGQLLLGGGALPPVGTSQNATTSMDFRVFDGVLGFRLAVSDGDIIVEPMGTSVTLRASNGTFLCDLKALSCQ